MQFHVCATVASPSFPVNGIFSGGRKNGPPRKGYTENILKLLIILSKLFYCLPLCASGPAFWTRGKTPVYHALWHFCLHQGRQPPATDAPEAVHPGPEPGSRNAVTRLALFIAALAALVTFAMNFFSSTPLRGMGTIPESPVPALLSRTRPPAALVPAEGMEPVANGWCDVHPASHGALDGDAKGWFAIYRGQEGTLVTAILEAGGTQWEWEGANHPPFPTKTLMNWSEERGNRRTAHFCTMELDEKTDPFLALEAPASGRTLVCRMAFLEDFRRTLVIAEYREPEPENLLGGARANSAFVEAFVRRAFRTCTVLFPTKQEAEAYKKTITKMATLDKSISRRALARWAGEMRRRQDN